jgi:hypothetical protein
MLSLRESSHQEMARHGKGIGRTKELGKRQ